MESSLWMFPTRRSRYTNMSGLIRKWSDIFSLQKCNKLYAAVNLQQGLEVIWELTAVRINLDVLKGAFIGIMCTEFRSVLQLCSCSRPWLFNSHIARQSNSLFYSHLVRCFSRFLSQSLWLVMSLCLSAVSVYRAMCCLCKEKNQRSLLKLSRQCLNDEKRTNHTETWEINRRTTEKYW